ncbi:hypothetical protein [Elizabethkingia phage TCUEAP1]|nr:hypothetical protein [Elizabethkingia phage TCUEAP1]
MKELLNNAIDDVLAEISREGYIMKFGLCFVVYWLRKARNGHNIEGLNLLSEAIKNNPTEYYFFEGMRFYFPKGEIQSRIKYLKTLKQ